MKFFKDPQFIEGGRAMHEFALGFMAWSIVTNIALLSAGLNPMQTFWFNFLVFAGSAQLAVMPLIAGDYPLWTIWFTAFVVNLRFVIFSAAIQPYFKKYPFWGRVGIGYFNGDIPFAKFLQKFPSRSKSSADHGQLSYFLGMALSNWLVWQAGVLLAIAFGTYIPNTWGIGFAGALALVALVIPAIKDKTSLVSAIAAIFTCILTVNFPYRLTIVCSVIAGVGSAVLMNAKFKKVRYD